ncbi:hypothetical protein ISN44_As02g000600 [Arabidopsis suecica]|uniref:F-box domain-containing protein n=2 Tax=Arabidopsis TaxID=3701 RepID=A0A8T2FVW4_ARASU|nr:hypothetical protein ISN44_As02g000600 [Arabidopsis suecica]
MKTELEEEEEEEWRSVHEVLLIVLPYLHSLFELLSMTRVSRSLRDAIRDEIALWTKFVIEPPLSSRLTDDILSEFSSKSAGKLKTLILRQCLMVTDKGLRRVVDANPLITKIIVPGCSGLTPEGIMECVESLSKNNHKLETLHINGVNGFTKQHLSALYTYLSSEGTIDLEVCPKCDEVRMIPSCSRESCNQKQRKCRGCWLCIPRCAECAVCLVGSDTESQEAACGNDDVLCLECWLVLPKCRFCNKPYCTNHSSRRHEIAITDAVSRPSFECEACYYRAGTNPYEVDYQI